MGKVYKRLILGIAKENGLSIVDALFEVYHSFVSDKINKAIVTFLYPKARGTKPVFDLRFLFRRVQTKVI